MNIELGSGNKKRDGFKSVDYNADLKPDVVWDLNKLPWPFKTHSVDNIYTNMVLEHLTLELPAFIVEVRRVLKPNGEIELITHNNFFWKYRIAFLLGVFKQEQGWHVNHSFIIKIGELKRFFEFNGFDVDLKPTTKFWGVFEKIWPNMFARHTHLIARRRP